MIKYFDEEGIITPFGENIKADVAITAFSTHTYEELLRITGAQECAVIKGGCDVGVFVFERNGKRIAVYKSPVGAPAAVATMEEVMATGVKHVIAFGICGALVHTPPHMFIVPDKAIRDEGTSYHYLPAAESIAVKNCQFVNKALNDSGIDTLVGGTWTTDGFYRETRTRAEQVKAAGCIAVDMECSALQAAADFRGKQFYTFFITADSLAEEQWQPNDILDLKATDSTTVAVCAAIKLAEELA
ncbi:MAG: nucleoside phosphorylase [Clostridiales bacterium]|nr:nucleoside phosphorylase [Clostridiales bacterium]